MRLSATRRMRTTARGVVIKTCPYCSSPIRRRAWQKPNEYEKTLFCSRSCSSKSRAQDGRRAITSRVEVGDKSHCWIWLGHKNNKGYGYVSVGGKLDVAHRHAWRAFCGGIPNGMHVLHHCDNPPCCNPDHLFLGTNADNVRDRIAKGRSADVRGAKNGRAKLTEDDVRAIRMDSKSHGRVAREYGVRPYTVQMIRQRKTWAHVP